MNNPSKITVRAKALAEHEGGLKGSASEVEAQHQEDWVVFNRLTSMCLSPEEEKMAVTSDQKGSEAKEFMAIHWHPEWVPLELIQRRVDGTFPQAKNSLLIPTQHNKIMSLGAWAGVEADVYASQYGLKVQLLIHFPVERLPQASGLQAMMNKTYNYRANQLLNILDGLVETDPSQVSADFSICSVSEPALNLARVYAGRLRALVERSGLMECGQTEMLKNRLLSDFIFARTKPEDGAMVQQALVYIEAVKKKVKSELNPNAFYSPEEVIEEARGFGAGVVIPHPPMFWPILLSNLDVDGWEVWNPSTPKHTLFLLDALKRANQLGRRSGRRPLLVFMADDTHMSGKIRPNINSKKVFSTREIGFQAPWFDLGVKDALKGMKQSLLGTLTEYKARLS